MRLFEEIEADVLEWATEEGVFLKVNPESQARKTLEECEEAFAQMDYAGMLAVEIGDILATLVIQCRMQGLKLSECRHNTPVIGPVPAWANLSQHIGNYYTAVASGSEDVGLCIASLYACFFEGAAKYCGKTPPECMELAYQKIKGRTGKMVDGFFVKDVA